MIWLPALDVDGCPRRLPLAERSAPALAALLIDGASRESQIAVRDALALDPALALWAIVCAAQAGCAELTTVEALADWLAKHVGRTLRWPEGAEPVLAECGWSEEYLRLLNTSRALARRAREVAGAVPVANEAYLLGLIYAADQWWALDQRGNTIGAQVTTIAAPPWLSTALDQLKRRSEDLSGAAACVFEARQSIDEDQREVELARALPGDAAIASTLPKLAAAVARYGLLRNQFEGQLEAEKLEAMAEFAAGAGHEINNPLAVISGRAQLLIADETNPERRRELAIMNTQAMRVFEMISDMMLFARPPKPHLAECDLSAIVDRVLSELAPKIAERNATIERLGDKLSLMFSGDAMQLTTAVRALCDNALTVIGRGGKITVSTGRGRDANGHGEAVIAIRDTGPGIPPEVRRHLFDPFYSGRRAGRGLGMGLAKCWRIVTNHGGTIDVESAPDEGATFTIRLPIYCTRTP